MREYISNAFWVLVTWVVGVCSIIIGVGTFSHQSSTAFEFAILFIGFGLWLIGYPFFYFFKWWASRPAKDRSQ